MTSLKELIVTRTAVTAAGVAELQKKLPDTEIQLQSVPASRSRPAASALPTSARHMLLRSCSSSCSSRLVLVTRTRHSWLENLHHAASCPTLGETGG